MYFITVITATPPPPTPQRALLASKRPYCEELPKSLFFCSGVLCFHSCSSDDTCAFQKLSLFRCICPSPPKHIFGLEQVVGHTQTQHTLTCVTQVSVRSLTLMKESFQKHKYIQGNFCYCWRDVLTRHAELWRFWNNIGSFFNTSKKLHFKKNA